MALAGLVLPIAVFFNLYWVHDYYLIAVTPALAFLGAAASPCSSTDLSGTGRGSAPSRSPSPCLSTVPCWSYVAPTYEVSRDAPLARLGALVAGARGQSDWVVVQGDEWNSRILYSSRRRGFMIWEGRTDVRPLASRPEFGALVCRECTPELLALFPRRRLVGHEAELGRLPGVAGGRRAALTGLSRRWGPRPSSRSSAPRRAPAPGSDGARPWAPCSRSAVRG